MSKKSFIEVGNIIFNDKNSWNTVTDEEKELNFFILNKKFSLGFPKQAMFFNDKNIDKATVMDIWFNYFKLKKINGILSPKTCTQNPRHPTSLPTNTAQPPKLLHI